MRRIFTVLAIVAIPISIAVSAHAQESTSTRPHAEGVVVDEHGDPIAGVQYWSNGFRLGHDGERGRIRYSGMNHVRETDENGRFDCPYGGDGREETAIDISFQHENYAPAFLVNVNQANGPYTVTVERGLRLTGTLEGTGRDQLEGRYWSGPVRLRLDVVHNKIGGAPTSIPIETENDGWFETRIPTEHWNCVYFLRFAGTRTVLEFDKDKPLPKLRINFDVKVEQDRSDEKETE